MGPFGTDTALKQRVEKVADSDVREKHGKKFTVSIKYTKGPAAPSCQSNGFKWLRYRFRPYGYG